MSGYELARGAFGDLKRLAEYTERKQGRYAAEYLEDRLLSACERLAEFPGLGHRRSDLTLLPVFFYTEEPYLIMYSRQVDPLPILAFFHSSRNVKQLLQSSRFVQSPRI